jgi:hypothetical protein
MVVKMNRIRFKDYLSLTEGRKPMWLKVVVGGMVLKVRNLSIQIQSEKDPQRQNQLLSQQNNLISYIVGLGIGVNSNDTPLTQIMRKGMVGKN